LTFSSAFGICGAQLRVCKSPAMALQSPCHEYHSIPAPPNPVAQLSWWLMQCRRKMQQKQEDGATGPLKSKGQCLPPNGACREVGQKVWDKQLRARPQQKREGKAAARQVATGRRPEEPRIKPPRRQQIAPLSDGGNLQPQEVECTGTEEKRRRRKAQRTERRGQPPPLGAPARQLEYHRMQGSSAPQHPGIGKAKKSQSQHVPLNLSSHH